MNESITDPRPLEHVDTTDLVQELQRRSRVFFLALRPLADDPDFTAMYSIEARHRHRRRAVPVLRQPGPGRLQLAGTGR